MVRIELTVLAAAVHSTVQNPYCAGSNKQNHTEVLQESELLHLLLDDSPKYNQWACTEISVHTHTLPLTDTSGHGYQLIILVSHDSLKVFIRFLSFLLLHTDSISFSAHSVHPIFQ